MRSLRRKFLLASFLVLAATGFGVLATAAPASSEECATGSGGNTFYCVHNGELFYIDCMGGVCGGNKVSFY